ncbi:MAG: hypothetical protein IJ228_12545 [Succinivibrio sp.]|nr:hypothetical protein [Succinivibrio sp.]
MFNPVEWERLQSSALSHPARSLYLLLIKPLAERNITTLTVAKAQAVLYSSSAYFPTAPSAEMAQLCLDELEEAGFIVRQDPTATWDNCEVTYPLHLATLDEVPQLPFRLQRGWRPQGGFAEACLSCGLADAGFSERELSDFVSYWSSRPEQRNQHAWECAFARRLISRRSAKSRR